MRQTELFDCFQNKLIFDGLANNTLKNYLSMLRKFLEDTGKDPQNFTPEDFKNYIKEKPSSFPVLRRFFHLLLEKDLIQGQLIVRSQKKYKPREVEEKDYSIIASNIDSIQDPLSQVIIALLISSLRFNEARNVRAEDITSWGFIEARKITAKGKRGRTIAVSPEILKVLLTHIEKNKLNPKDYLLLNGKGNKISKKKFYELFYKGMADLGFNKYIPHHLRHLAITHRQNFLSLEALMNETGHSSPGQLTGYTSMNLETIRNNLSVHPWFTFYDKEDDNA